MKVRLGDLRLDDVVRFFDQNNLKLVVAENKNDVSVNHVNVDFLVEVEEPKDVTRDGSDVRESVE